MALSPKMLPCKKRRATPAGSEKEELPDARSVEMETPVSGGLSQPCIPALPKGEPEDATLAPKRDPTSSHAGRTPCLSPPHPHGHLTSVDDGSGVSPGRSGQKDPPEGPEPPLKSEGLFLEEDPGDHRAPKHPPPSELLVEKKVEKQDLTAGSDSPDPKAGGGSPGGKGAEARPGAELPPDAKEETEETGLFIPVDEPDEGGKRKRRKAAKRKRDGRGPEGEPGGGGGGGGGGQPMACDLKLDDALDRTLEDGAKQHNLTAVNVRNILHEVITNEHVVAMMKAAISETEDIPMFEPKMTRSKLKEVVEKGVVIPTWNISPIKKANEVKPPQFVDIPLEEDDSSDEEYQPEEEEEDETAEESLLESDVESTASSPRGAKRSRSARSSDVNETDEEAAAAGEAESAATPPLQRHISAEVVPMGPPPPPKPKQSKDTTFMEKLHAVDEELASSPVCMEAFQPLEDSLIALRTRSKRPLKDVPLGQLEAELRAPDITPDMYDPNTADDEEWKRWLGGLMNDDVGNEDEADDDDDPEYNFLEDLDEPDTEDYRNDRAVRITKKEVNELMEELFETFQDEMGFSNVEDDGPEDEDSGGADTRPNFNTPQVLRFEEPLANLLNEQHRTVKEQLEQLRMRKSAPKLCPESERAALHHHDRPAQALTLDAGQRRRLAQQMEQHVQLLTQVHFLCSANPSLSSEAGTARLFLTELDTFARSSLLLCQPHGPDFRTAFEPRNLKEALRLVHDVHADVKVEWSPQKDPKKNVSDFSCLPKQLAWIFATRRVFLYPELLPTCSLKAKTPRDKVVFTKGEDNLLALGLKHFEGTEFPKPLISKYLLTTKTAHQLTVRIKNLNMNRVPDNILKYYKTTKQLPALPRLCGEIPPGDWKPPMEREEHHLPFWLKASLPFIQEALGASSPEPSPGTVGSPREGPEAADPGEDKKYPLLPPEDLQLILRPLNSRFCRKAWRRQRPAAKPLPVRPGLGPSPSAAAGHLLKTAPKHAQPEAPPGKAVPRAPRLIQPAPPLRPSPGVPHLRLQPAVGGQAGLELRGLFPAQQAGPRACLAAPTLPVAFQPKMMLPALPASRACKPGGPRGSQRKKGPRAAPLLKAAPLLRPAPVIFTVPAGAVKVVSLGGNVLQPLAGCATGGAGQPGQPIPIATLLVNPSPFPCPLGGPLAGGPAPSVVVASGPAGPPAPQAVRDPSWAPGGPPTGDAVARTVNAGSETEPREPSSCSVASAEEDGGGGAWCPDPDRGLREEVPADMEAPEGGARVSPSDAFSPLAVEKATVEAEEGPREPHWGGEARGPEVPPSGGSPPTKGVFVLDLGQELDMAPAPMDANEPKESLAKGGEEDESHQRGPRQPLQGTAVMAEGPGCPPAGVPAPAPGGIEVGGPRAGPEDPSCVATAPPAGKEAAGEKDGAEEEEEEEFDDDLPDEEDEEMSSASEESVLSVPELQETMEKLTWLASERRLSQEGDSEEENSPEENSEPEEEEEEEEEGENPGSVPKEGEMADEVADTGDGPAPCHALKTAVPEAEPRSVATGESAKTAPGKSRGSSRSRGKRGRGRASKDTSKLLRLYDEDILERDPLREQKDLAFAQAYLSRVREALLPQPGKYEAFLAVIYDFENNAHRQTAVDLYARLRDVLPEWPQLLADFAAFLLPEQALECGLFEEQQAFEKSRKFLRQLEICFAENPSHHQKIIRVLQGCAESLPQEIVELKTQMWQLLRGHDHLQDEFSVFFDHLRPTASRLGDFEEIHWTEEKEYEFDGFEEVSLPEVEEDEEPPKIQGSSKSKRRKDLGGPGGDKESEATEGPKEGPPGHEGSGDLPPKRSKRRGCGHCGHKAGESKTFRSRDPQELSEAPGPPEPSPRTDGKEPSEDGPTAQRGDGEPPPGKAKPAARRTEPTGAGPQGEGKPSPDAAGRGTAGCAPPELPCPKKAGEAPKRSPAVAALSPPAQRGLPPKLPRPQSDNIPGETEDGLGRQIGASQAAGSPVAQGEPGAATGEARPEAGAPGPKDPPRDTQASVAGGLLLPQRPAATEGASPSERARGAKPTLAGARDRAPPSWGEDAPARAGEATVCAKNIKVSSTGEKVVLWTREADRVILTACQERGADPDTFRAVSRRLRNKTAEEVAHRFRELMALFHTACDVSSEEEEDGHSAGHADPTLSEEEQDGPGF